MLDGRIGDRYIDVERSVKYPIGNELIRWNDGATTTREIWNRVHLVNSWVNVDIDNRTESKPSIDYFNFYYTNPSPTEILLYK